MGLLGAIGAGIAAGAEYGAQGVLEQYKSILQEERSKRLLEMQEEIRQKGKQFDNEQDVAMIGKKAKATAEAASDNADTNIATAKKVKLGTDYDPEILAAEQGKQKGEAKVKADAAREAVIASGSDPAYLKANKAIAQSGHIESQSSIMNAALAKFQLDRAKLVAGAQDELAVATKSGNKDAITAARKNLEALNSKGDDPKSASSMISMSKAYLMAAQKEDDAGNTDAAQEFRTQAKMWGDLAKNELNAGDKDKKNDFVRDANGKIVPAGSKPADQKSNTQSAAKPTTQTGMINQEEDSLVKGVPVFDRPQYRRIKSAIQSGTANEKERKWMSDMESQAAQRLKDDEQP